MAGPLDLDERSLGEWHADRFALAAIAVVNGDEATVLARGRDPVAAM